MRAQWFTQTSVMPMPHTASTAGMSRGGVVGARGVAVGLLVIEAVNQIGVPAYQSYQMSQAQSTARDLHAFARRILFWAQMGARPSIVGVKDPLFSTGPTRVRDFDEVMTGLRDKKWDAVAIESPGLSDTDVFILGVFLSENIRNYDEYYELFEASYQDAVRWQGQPWESSTWEIKVGHYDTSGINEVEEKWEKHERLTELMRALVPRWIANTESTWAFTGDVSRPPRKTSPGSGHSVTHRASCPTCCTAQLKDPSKTRMKGRKRTESASGAPHRKTFIEHDVEWTTPPNFFVHGMDRDYLEVSGADFNTYTAIRPMWTEGTQLGMPYSTVFRIANETATCLLPASELVRIDEPTPLPVPPTPTRIEQRVYFPFAGKDPRTDANYDAMPVLDDVAAHLRANPAVKAKIVGHTDDVGEAPFNEKLSLDRATSVKALLEARGIAADRLSAEGGGKASPIATNSTEDGRARNRRVEFVGCLVTHGPATSPVPRIGSEMEGSCNDFSCVDRGSGQSVRGDGGVTRRRQSAGVSTRSVVRAAPAVAATLPQRPKTELPTEAAPTAVPGALAAEVAVGAVLRKTAAPAVGAADDPVEHEADVLAQEMLKSERKPCGCEGAGGSCQCGSGGGETVRRKATGAPSGPTPPTLALTGGSPLAPDDRSFFEARSGLDLSGVRVHADALTGEAARGIGALAFTRGSAIGFAAGQYQPGTPSGRNLLAHELAHVVLGHSGVRRRIDGESRSDWERQERLAKEWAERERRHRAWLAAVEQHRLRELPAQSATIGAERERTALATLAQQSASIDAVAGGQGWLSATLTSQGYAGPSLPEIKLAWGNALVAAEAVRPRRPGEAPNTDARLAALEAVPAFYDSLAAFAGAAETAHRNFVTATNDRLGPTTTPDVSATTRSERWIAKRTRCCAASREPGHSPAGWRCPGARPRQPRPT